MTPETIPGDEDDATQLSFEDTLTIHTTKAELWTCISDPAVLARCVPGADDVERVSERSYTIELTRGLSSLTISLTGDVELVELNEPDWIVATGTAYDPRSHSHFEGLAAMEVSATGEGTIDLTYEVELTFTGGIASLPSGIVGPLIRSDVDQYFENIRTEVTDGQ